MKDNKEGGKREDETKRQREGGEKQGVQLNKGQGALVPAFPKRSSPACCNATINERMKDSKEGDKREEETSHTYHAVPLVKDDQLFSVLLSATLCFAPVPSGAKGDEHE